MKRCLQIVMVILAASSVYAQQYGWQVASRPSTLPCGAIEFVDSLNGWINFGLDTPPRILRTRDGGYNWNPATLPAATNGITSISFVDTLHGWAVSLDGHVFGTTNGGQSWVLQYYPQFRRYWSNASLTTRKSLAGGGRTAGPDTGFISKTTNAGNLWNDQTFQNIGRIWAVDFVDTLNGWAAVDRNWILRSRDAGQTWNNLSTPMICRHLSFADSLLGWGLFKPGGADWILRTSDAGISWDTVLVKSGDVIIRDLHFADSLNGWVFADTLFASIVYHTTNGGITWLREAFNLTSGFGVGTATGRFHAWAGSDNGTILKYGILTGVDEQPSPLPKQFTLAQNYPNPFNPTTTIKYAIPKQSHVILTVTDVLGKQVRVLVDATQPAGSYSVEFDARGLASGIYFYQLKTEQYQETKQMTLVR